MALSDLTKMLPFLFFSLILFLLFIFKRVSGVLLPFLIIFASIMTTFGFSGFLGLKLNNLTTMIPNILIAICMADSVHLMVTFFQLRSGGVERKEAVYKAIIKNFFPIFMTSFSTSIGFFSLINTNLIPIKNLGLLAGIGTQMGLIFTFLLMAPLLSLLPINVKVKKSDNLETASNLPKDWSLRAVSFYKKFDIAIIAIFIFVFGSSLYFAYKNEVNANPYDYFSDNVPLKKANDFVLKKLGGTGGPEIVIKSGKPEGIKSPDFLKKVESLQSWIDSNPRVNKTVSIVNILKSMNRSLH
ncbi:MAG: MMPL family transporter, partial [Bdellovibrionota bacterium]|nr:MMPL family transporter [Bdellovibrionota bacterium]